MVRNYLKTAWKNLLRYKGYSLINIAGFALGIACCLLILVYTLHELSFDRYHRDAERVYRVVIDIQKESSSRAFALISPTVAPVLKSDYPQVEESARVLAPFWNDRLVKWRDKKFYEKRFMYVDPEIFEILTIPFVQGDAAQSLARPNTIVVSERMAGKYFGKENPLGEILTVNDEEFEVTGIVKNPPGNTHLTYDLIASLSTLDGWEELSNWHSTMFYTYVKLKPGMDPADFSRQIRRLADPYVGDLLAGWGTAYEYSLQPMPSIHLHSKLSYEIGIPGDSANILIFSFVGFFILIIAALNFINLSTARAGNRAREVGLRKVLGARPGQLITQFTGESLLMTAVSLGIALLAVGLGLPWLQEITGTTLGFRMGLVPRSLIALMAGAVVIGSAAGIYPAFVLSSFRPVDAIRGSTGSRRFPLRTVLVVIQFAISGILIIGTLTVARQMQFMKNQELGFDREQKLVLPLRGGIDIQQNFSTIKEMFARHPSVQGVTVSSSVPGRDLSSFSVRLVGEDDDRNQDMYHLYFDDDFIDDYQIGLVAGRSFQKEMKTDFMGAFLINEAAVRAFGWGDAEQALGKKLRTGHGGRVNPIIGVTEDFHYRGLQSEVEPLVMEFLPWVFRYVTLSVRADNPGETLAFVKSQWQSLWPEQPFEYFFLNVDFDRQYQAHERMGKLFGIFTFIGVFVACLGLLGLASYSAQLRIREIGIRKVLGASTAGITLTMTREFLQWVLLANVLAWPVAYFIMQSWLKNFAHRVTLDITVFIISGLISLIIALLTVSYQSLKAARAHPVESLRYE